MLEGLKAKIKNHTSGLAKQERILAAKREAVSQALAQAERDHDAQAVAYKARMVAAGRSSPVPAAIAEQHAQVQAAHDRAATLRSELSAIDDELQRISEKTGAAAGLEQCKREIRSLEEKASQAAARAHVLEEREKELREQAAAKVAEADKLRKKAAREAADGGDLALPPEVIKLQQEAEFASDAADLSHEDAQRLRSEENEAREEADQLRRYSLRGLIRTEAEVAVEAATADLMPLFARLAAAQHVDVVKIQIPDDALEKARAEFEV